MGKGRPLACETRKATVKHDVVKPSQAKTLVKARQVLPLVTKPLSVGCDEVLLRGWQGRSWLEAAEGDSYVCRACVMHAKGKSALATPGMVTSVKWGNFRRHAQGKLHEACVRKLLGAKNAELPGAPTTRQFQELWKAIRQGRSAQKQENSKTKALDMLWCLYEAMRLKDEEFLTQPGVVIALHRDERNRVIQCDFTAASSDLSTRSGVLHCAFNQGGAAGVLQGTKEIVRAALTSLDKQVKHGSENALRKAVELVCIDAAPDEVAASNEGHRPSFQDLQPYTPNLRWIARDKAHGLHKLRARVNKVSKLVPFSFSFASPRLASKTEADCPLLQSLGFPRPALPVFCVG